MKRWRWSWSVSMSEELVERCVWWLGCGEDGLHRMKCSNLGCQRCPSGAAEELVSEVEVVLVEIREWSV